MTKEEDEKNTEESKTKCYPQTKKNEPIPEFTTEEIQAAIDRLQRGKAGDNSRIKAEHIIRCSSKTKEWIRRIFNEIVQEEDCTPQT